MLTKFLKSSQSHYAQSQGEHHIVRTVRSVQQIPRHFTDYGKKQEL